ncbi:hypothetical protein CERSUDRAFT_90548 [Gelatoporia subvermispora B]|uniref:Uncharacterized protein n=1 Tax=Ceriporiopsis subvermispora (strain B) TaxID=914234 RepID=M2QXW7_CERS8|nr:hypothetical protein CERSUDRAFT_90548 [Gelatoporia subvermispora B]
MHSTGRRTQSGLPISLQGSLRASAKLLASPPGSSVTPFAEQLASARRALGAVTEEPRGLELQPYSEDFEEISYDELRASLFGQSFPSEYDCQNSPPSTLLSRSRSSLSRFKKLSLLSDRSRHSRSRAPATSNNNTDRSDDVSEDSTALILAFPRPPTYRGDFVRRLPQQSIESAPVEDISSVFYSGDPFGKSETPVRTEPEVGVHRREQSPESIDIPHDTRSTSQAEQPSSSKPFVKPLKRLRTLAKASVFHSSRKPTVHEADNAPHIKPSLDTTVEAPPIDSCSHVLPELRFDTVDFSPFLTDTELDGVPVSVGSITEHELEPEPEPKPSPPPGPTAPSTSFPHARFAPRLRIVPYQFVDPSTLSDSPAVPSALPTTQTATPLPPSPSWLSRNVKDVEPHAQVQTPVLYIRPPPSPPLPILPRSALPIRASREDRDSLVFAPQTVQLALTRPRHL